MKGLSINNNFLNFIEVGLLVMVAFPLLPNRLKSIPLFILLGIAIFYFVFEKERIFNWRLFITNSSIFILYIISLLYTTNTEYAFTKLETALSILFYPLIFGLIWKSREKINKTKILNRFIYLFFWSVFIYTCVIFIYLVYIGLFKHYKDPNFFRHFTEVIPFIGQHSIYASIFLALGLLSSVYLLKNKKNKNQIIFIWFGIIIFTILLLSLASKGVLVAVFIALSTYLILQFNKLKKSLIFIILTLGILTLGMLFSPSLSKRVTLFISNTNSKDILYNEELNSTQIRKEIYKCSTKSIKENWLFGTGLGDANDSLMKCYSTTSASLVKGEYNAHNQYLSILLGLGLLGFITFIYFLFFNFKVAITNKNYLYFSIVLFYSIVMLIENVIERRSGVVMFSFLLNFLYFLTDKEKSKQA